MEASQGEEGGRKHIGAEIDAGLKQFPILVHLTNNEDTAEQDREREPTEHRTAMLFRQANFRSPKSEAASEKANAEQKRAWNIQLLRPGAGLWPGVEIQVGEDERGEESRFGKNEAQHPYFVVIGKGYGRAVLTDDRVGPVRIGQVPERPATADRRQCDKV